MRRHLWVAALPLAVAVAGCLEYTDRVGCRMGEVLNDVDECVVAPGPDGGVPVETCADLCAAIAGFDDAQLGCIETNLEMAGPPPTECMADLRVAADCTACVGAVGLDDRTCAIAGTTCQ